MSPGCLRESIRTVINEYQNVICNHAPRFCRASGRFGLQDLPYVGGIAQDAHVDQCIPSRHCDVTRRSVSYAP